MSQVMLIALTKAEFCALTSMKLLMMVSHSLPAHMVVVRAQPEKDNQSGSKRKYFDFKNSLLAFSRQAVFLSAITGTTNEVILGILPGPSPGHLISHERGLALSPYRDGWEWLLFFG